MNLYLISQSVNNDYDTYDSAVVCAETAEDARLIRPDYDLEPRSEHEIDTCWASPGNVDVKLIGTADSSIPKNYIVCASFSAG